MGNPASFCPPKKKGIEKYRFNFIPFNKSTHVMLIVLIPIWILHFPLRCITLTFIPTWTSLPFKLLPLKRLKGAIGVQAVNSNYFATCEFMAPTPIIRCARDVCHSGKWRMLLFCWCYFLFVSLPLPPEQQSIIARSMISREKKKHTPQARRGCNPVNASTRSMQLMCQGETDFNLIMPATDGLWFADWINNVIELLWMLQGHLFCSECHICPLNSFKLLLIYCLKF